VEIGLNFLRNIPNKVISERVCVLAHGAGAPMDSDFMTQVAEGIAHQGIEVVRFEFPYMAQRRQTGRKSPPNRAPALIEYFNQVVDELGGPQGCIIGGKSMGGRMATMVAAERKVAGVFALGYPFHPTGKPEKLRIEHLLDIQSPALILQGERDALGNKSEVDSYNLPKGIKLEWLPDGDHDLKPRVRSGYTHVENLSRAIDSLATFIKAC